MFTRKVFAALCSLFVFSSSIASADQPVAEAVPKVETEKETTKVVETEKHLSALDFDMKTLANKDCNLAKKYEDDVVLLVNVASRCGLTPQYKGLQELHAKYAKQGLRVVGVPCNQFRKQEPGTAEEISQFCKENYGVEFDLLAKVNVNGKDACPLYKSLTSKKTNPKFSGRISWNFGKFLFNRNGEVVARFSPRIKPNSRKMIAAIEKELAVSKKKIETTAAVKDKEATVKDTKSKKE